MNNRNVVEASFRENIRLERLVRSAVARMALDLTGIRVLTEAATGPYAATVALAALAGADEVWAITRNSQWGYASEIINNIEYFLERIGVQQCVHFIDGDSSMAPSGCDLVTNLGFVRPIDRVVISKLSHSAVVALMWEPWEFRPGEIDLEALHQEDIPIIATAEQHAEVRTFDYIGPTIGRLLLEEGVEIVRSRLLLVGSDPFGESAATWLAAAGASVVRASPMDWGRVAIEARNVGNGFDSLVLVEHRDHRMIIGSKDERALAVLAKDGVPIIRLCGVVDSEIIRGSGCTISPDVAIRAGSMTVTTAYAGSRPVVDLHAAGLKAGSIVVRARQQGQSSQEAVAAAIASGYGLAMESVE
ncbi:MAG: hypothetical protein NPIRA04_05780 [Nitrospirales bacterium]|nr:MAG: hypothetical protein NPIRA04_05780 [Nitrospirales bacterium]